jgi:hypothetical protein
MQLQDLRVALLSFGLALVPLLLFLHPFLSFRIGMIAVCHCILEVGNLLYDFYGDSQLSVCLEFQRSF